MSFTRIIKKIISYGIIVGILIYTVPQLTNSSSKQKVNVSFNTPWDQSPYFDTQFLSDYGLVQQALQNNGFKEGFFSTTDNHSINYLYLERQNSDYNVICCSGWWPGRKEGLSPLYMLLPKNSNILFFDARGHGKSDGSFLESTWKYGQNEYQDIIGAIKFLHKKNNKPIMVFGVCAGAFHAAHALITLSKEQKLAQYNIKGLVFDSGLTSVATTALLAPRAHINGIILKGLSKIYTTKNKNELKQKLPFKIISPVINTGIKVIHALFFKKSFEKREKTTNLHDKMDAITVPVLFIHSYDDAYVPINRVKDIARSVPNKTCWWIKKPSKHACHHLKHKHAYREKLHEFIASIIA